MFFLSELGIEPGTPVQSPVHCSICHCFTLRISVEEWGMTTCTDKSHTCNLSTVTNSELGGGQHLEKQVEWWMHKSNLAGWYV